MTIRNPFTEFAMGANVGDEMHGFTVEAVEVTGPAANPEAFRRVTFSGHGERWTTDYPNNLKE